MNRKKSQQKLNASKKRGKLLTILLIFATIALFLTPFTEFYRLLYGSNAMWLTTRWIINVVIVIGLWQWKKIAVYSYFLFAAILFLITCFTIYPHNPYWLTGIGVIGFLIFNFLWFYAIKRTWHFFT